jgi:hypothetical protein
MDHERELVKQFNHRTIIIAKDVLITIKSLFFIALLALQENPSQGMLAKKQFHWDNPLEHGEQTIYRFSTTMTCRFGKTKSVLVISKCKQARLVKYTEILLERSARLGECVYGTLRFIAFVANTKITY